MKKITIFILSTLMLTGCGTYSRYHRADIPTENLYRNIPEDMDTTPLASLSWREMFTDRKLQSLIETGLQQNTDLNVARLRVEAAEATLMTAKLSYLPSLGMPKVETAVMTGQPQRHIMSGRPQVGNWIYSASSRLQSVVRLPHCKEAVTTSKPYRHSLSPQ